MPSFVRFSAVAAFVAVVALGAAPAFADDPNASFTPVPHATLKPGVKPKKRVVRAAPHVSPQPHR